MGRPSTGEREDHPLTRTEKSTGGKERENGAEGIGASMGKITPTEKKRLRRRKGGTTDRDQVSVEFNQLKGQANCFEKEKGRRRRLKARSVYDRSMKGDARRERLPTCSTTPGDHGFSKNNAGKLPRSERRNKPASKKEREKRGAGGVKPGVYYCKS